jgi:putative transposase
VSLYRFIDAQKADYGTLRLCRVMDVPESSYFDWNNCGRRVAAAKADREQVLVEQIRVFHDASTATYGSPRIHTDLVEGGVVVSKRRVAEVMAANGIVGLSGREHSTLTTRRDRLEAPFPDLVQRQFHPTAPDVCWYGDITYIWIDNKFWYLATVLDAHTKAVVGWAFADHMRAELAIEALNAAVARRGGTTPPGLIFHTDRGSQYTSEEFGKWCRLHQIRQSMGRRGVCYDNAGAESFFATIKRELVNRYYWKSVDQLRGGLFQWIETWYNRRRRHSTIGNRTPARADTGYRQRQAA